MERKTDLPGANSSLRENASDYEYNALMAAMEVSVSKHLLDEYYTMIWGNDYYYDLIRYPREEYKKKFQNRPDIYYAYHGYEEELEKVSQAAMSAIAEGKSGYSIITRMPVKGSGHRWVRMTGKFMDEYIDGQRVSYTVITDIDDLVQMQREQSVTYDKIPGFVAKCRINRGFDMELMDANGQFKTFFDIPGRRKKGISLSSQYLGKEEAIVRSQWNYLMKGESVRFTVNVQNKKGEILRVQISGECVDWVESAPIYLFVYIDITDLTDLRDMQKKLEQQALQLQEALREAENASRAKSDFFSSMSHDIRTPMNAIVGMTEIASNHLDDPDKVRDCLRKITTSSQHLLGLINDVLDMSKIESGQMVLRNDTMFLPEIMQNIVTIIQPMVKGKRQHFSIRVRNLEHEYYICDSLRLHQCFINILSNASKFTPEGGSIAVEVEESPSLSGTHGELTFRFIDTGIGIKEEFLGHIFDSFTRERDSRVDKTEGSGLGMAITKKIVDLMGGAISVESSLGKGTAFTIHLSMEIDNGRTCKMSLPPLKVLVVDDDEIMCEYTTQTLQDCGVDAKWVDNGKEAVEMIDKAHREREDYDAVILDWQMPRQNGMETVAEIRNRIRSEIPILIASAYDWSEIEREAERAGVNGFLSKPLFQSTLCRGLQKYVLHVEDIPAEKSIEKKYDFSNKRILLAEDNELNAEIAVELLSETGAEVEVSYNGVECMEKFKNSPEGYYNLILMDIQMPVMNGYTATKLIRKLERSDAGTIPILAMTADAFAEDVTAALEVGMNSHLSKPLDIATMKYEISKFL